MKPETTKAIVLVAIAAAIFAAGWAVEGWRMGAKLARVEKAHAEAETKAAKENTARLAAANQRGDFLLLQLNGWKDTLTQFAEEKNREIDRLATGRRCLDGPLVRVLNRSPDIKLPRSVPEATGHAVRAPATAAADPDDGRFATDGDVARWANQCRLNYDTCRSDRDAIANFYAGEKAE